MLDEEDEEEAEDGMEDSDEDDDTAELVWVCGAAPEKPPEGYTYAPCPPLETEEEQRALVGRRVLVAHVVDPIGCTSAGLEPSGPSVSSVSLAFSPLLSMTAPKLVRGLEPHCAKGMWAAYASLEWVLQTERSVRRPTSWCGTQRRKPTLR